MNLFIHFQSFHLRFNVRPNFSSYKKLCLPPSLGKGEVPGRKFTAALVQFYKQTKCQAGIVGGESG